MADRKDKIKMSHYLHHHFLIAKQRSRYMNKPRLDRRALLGILNLIGVTQRVKMVGAHPPGEQYLQ